MCRSIAGLVLENSVGRGSGNKFFSWPNVNINNTIFQAVLPPQQNGPVSSLINNGQLPPNMKPFIGNSSGYDSSMTSEFSALNLSIPSTSKVSDMI